MRIRSVRSVVASARRLGARDAGILRQVDTYYCVPSGRMKLRQINGKRSELILYDRPSSRGSRYSRYSVLPVSDPRAMDSLLAHMFGREVVVRKTRRLYLFRNARIHIDRVSGLGDFLEFEVVVDKGKRQARGIFEKLVDAFDVDLRKTEAGSYRELKLQHRA